jgi:hypothetical protein
MSANTQTEAQTEAQTEDRQLQDAIEQADWLVGESGYTDLDDLLRTNPELFEHLATQWRSDNPAGW